MPLGCHWVASGLQKQRCETTSEARVLKQTIRNAALLSEEEAAKAAKAAKEQKEEERRTAEVEALQKRVEVEKLQEDWKTLLV